MKNKILYKYCDWDNIFHRSILTNNEIYFSSPDQFNDPFDANPPYVFDDNIERKKIVAILKEQYPNDSDEQIVAHYNRSKDQIFRKNATKFRDSNYEYLNDQIGILCLTNNSNSNLMWSHYANMHNGFIVGFDYFNLYNEIFSDSTCELIINDKMHYDNSVINLSGIELSSVQILLEILCKKSIEWECEDEHRIIINRPRHKITISNGVFKEIILGNKISGNSINEIANILQNKNSDIILKQAIMTYDSFNMRYETIKY